ncbi:MAG: type I 3-dehydroquinate dehydratase [Elusimicrobia bacterium]|nr:type I 3-dehydroquinate dehydratase [Elusimicrobiota bacterium]
MMGLTIKELGKIPKIAMAITDKEDNKQIKFLNVDILEIRVDQFDNLDPQSIRKSIILRKKTGLPLILTIRSKEEGGQKEIPNDLKLKIFKNNISSIDAIDIELKSPLLAKIVELAKINRKIIIVSWHDFSRTPKSNILEEILNKALKSGGQIIKIAAKANNAEDFIRLLDFTLKNKNNHLITISLGEIGCISRLIFPKLGSLLTYSYINKPSGPGQIPLEKLQEDFRLYYPEYNKYYIKKSATLE